MKRITAAAIAAFLLLFTLCMTAHAEPTEGSDTPTGMEYPPNTNPFTPNGTGTVVDFATGEDGKIFYTIVTPDESVFYLVVDRQRNTENVYFLNAVTVDDLLSLAANPVPKPGTVVVPVTPPPTESNPAEPTPAPEPEQSGGNNTGMLIIVLVLAVLGGGAGWYFKIYKPKQQGAGADEYEPPVEDEDDFYPDGWDDVNESGGGDDDMPPWDEDEYADEDGADE